LLALGRLLGIAPIEHRDLSAAELADDVAELDRDVLGACVEGDRCWLKPRRPHSA